MDSIEYRSAQRIVNSEKPKIPKIPKPRKARSKKPEKITESSEDDFEDSPFLHSTEGCICKECIDGL